MPVWIPPAVEHAPRLVLICWTLIQTERGEVHVVGYNLDDAEGRVSSPLHQFNTRSRVGVTRSGRAYELHGPPGTNDDAAYVFGRWRTLNRVTAWCDVTEQVLASGLPAASDDRPRT